MNNKPLKNHVMKKLLLTSSLLILALMVSFSGKAQTSVNISWVADSSNNFQYCPPPVGINLIAYGDATGYNNVTDSMNMHIFWGDGTDTLFWADLFNNGASDYFFTSTPHNYTMAGQFFVTVVATGPDGNDDTLTYGPITVSSGCVTVDGYCYQDNNSNCVFDAGDDTLAGVPLIIENSGGALTGYTYTNAHGYYSTSIPSGLTGLTIEPSLYWSGTYNTVSCPVAGNYTFNSSGNASFNFGMTCTSSNYDLYAHHSISGVGAPGSNAFLSIYAGNNSCTSVAGTVTLVLDPNVSYVGMISGPAPSSVTGNTLTWNTNFTGGSYWGYSFYAKLDIYTSTSATILTPACFTVSIAPTAADLMPQNNSDNWCITIGGPYDPNNKEVIPAGVGATGDVAPNTEFTYTINFQNTGTAPAINVYVMDTISTNLDMSSFQVVASSHNMNPQFFDGNIVRFDFPNINLPDSNASEPLSHGWVTYRIKAKSGIANGSQISNTGHIYFDYNSAIVTNTTLNTIDIALGTNELNAMALSNTLFPNPAGNAVRVQFANAVSGNLSLVDLSGRVVKTLNVTNAETVIINLSDLSSGIYGIVMPGVELTQNRLQVIR
jgi:uncharacterized repeat protein (TIGR01451 family)